MATQVLLEELSGCKTYLGWLIEKLDYLGSDEDDSEVKSKIKWMGSEINWLSPEANPELKWMSTEISRELCRLMFEIDFTWLESVKEDEIRAKDALEIREKYAQEVGKLAGKSSRDIDRIWKSVHGKVSVLEIIFSLCVHLDEMFNEEEPWKMVGFFYRILIRNLALDEFDDEDFDHRESEIRDIWKGRIKQFLRREYFESGCCGGLFPLNNWDKDSGKNQKEVGLWYQMNAWVNEHVDDDGMFKIE